jgi:outer membrane receptor for ferrienterochelin and colicin
VASVRRSYLQFLFAGLGLPFLPTYNDFQFKVHSTINSKNEITFMGLGAYDQDKLNLSANKTEEQRYILGYLPENDQWSYTFGAVCKHFGQRSSDTWVLSRNHLNNIQIKYRNNIQVDSLKLLDYNSYEEETKFRYERTISYDAGYKLNAGANTEYAEYYNRTFRQTFTNLPLNYSSSLEFVKWGLFAQLTKTFINDKLSFSLGTRVDANTYSSKMTNPFTQLSPRFSVSYVFAPKWSINGNIGRYYQLPPYTTLGYRNNNGELVNKQNGMTYISADHLVTGFDFLPDEASKFSIEGFYKWYRNYPLSVADSVSISSKGADFGTYGDEAILSQAKGKAFGAEVFYQTKNMQGLDVIFSYTFVRSEAENAHGNFIPTAWDNKHMLNITALHTFKRHWDVGFKWRFVGGAPYTPWDLNKSTLASAWDAQGQAYLDYSRYNQLRLKAFHQLDIRIDKQYYLRTWSMRFYLDIQNVYNFKSDQPDDLVRAEDTNGVPLPATGTPPRYQLKSINGGGSGTILPTVGVIIEL